MSEIERLKIKCNQYAKRLVNLGEDDVSWEVSDKLTSTNTTQSEILKCNGGGCSVAYKCNCKKGSSRCEELRTNA